MRTGRPRLLTEEQVERLRKARAEGVPVRFLAERFGVSENAIRRALTKERG